ncbi:MAG: TolC family protein, partial [Rickettsiales bacterium]
MSNLQIKKWQLALYTGVFSISSICISTDIIAADNENITFPSDTTAKEKSTPFLEQTFENVRSIFDSNDEKNNASETPTSTQVLKTDQSIATLQQSAISLQQAAISLQQAAISLQQATESSVVNKTITPAASTTILPWNQDTYAATELKPLIATAPSPAPEQILKFPEPVVSESSIKDKPSEPVSSAQFLSDKTTDLAASKTASENNLETSSGTVSELSERVLKIFGSTHSEPIIASPEPMTKDKPSELVSDTQSLTSNTDKNSIVAADETINKNHQEAPSGHVSTFAEQVSKFFESTPPEEVKDSSELIVKDRLNDLAQGAFADTAKTATAIENNPEKSSDNISVAAEHILKLPESTDTKPVITSLETSVQNKSSSGVPLELLADSANKSNEFASIPQPLSNITDKPVNLPPSKDINKNTSLGGYSAFKKFLADSKGIVSLNVSQYAQTANVLEPIRLDEAVAFALKNNLEMKASVSRTKSAALEKMTAYSRFLPALDVKFSKGSEESMPASYNDMFGNRTLNDKHTRRDRTFAVRQPLIDLEIVADIVTSADKENLAKTQELDDRDGIAYDTVNTYLKLLQARISVQLADQYRTHLDELSARMKARLEGGGATIGDLERIKANASSAEVARAEALGEYESNLAEFRRLTQITPAQLQVSEVLVPEVPDSLTDAVKNALEKNPSYLASQEKLNIATSTLHSSIAKIAPKVSLEYSDTYSYNAGGAAKGNPVDGVYPDQQDKRLLLVAHW